MTTGPSPTYISTTCCLWEQGDSAARLLLRHECFPQRGFCVFDLRCCRGPAVKTNGPVPTTCRFSTLHSTSTGLISSAAEASEIWDFFTLCSLIFYVQWQKVQQGVGEIYRIGIQTLTWWLEEPVNDNRIFYHIKTNNSTIVASISETRLTFQPTPHDPHRPHFSHSSSPADFHVLARESMVWTPSPVPELFTPYDPSPSPRILWTDPW